MEKFESFDLNYKQIFDDKIQQFFARIKNHFHDLSDEQKKEISIDAVSADIQKIIDLLDPNAKEFLSQLEQKDFDAVIGGCFEEIRKDSGAFSQSITLDNIRNYNLYQQVYGYGNPEVENRENKNPLPTAAEVLMGCYMEQIEKQTRTAVILLRQKGYPTFESGFQDHFRGTQFFGISHDSADIVVPENLAKQMQERFNVVIKSEERKDRVVIDIVPDTFHSIEEWKEILDFFAQGMPVIGEVSYTSVGAAVDFVAKTMEMYSLQAILNSAQSDHERELIKRIYGCKNYKELAELLGNDDYIEWHKKKSLESIHIAK
jgi:hypothetical protein